MKRPDLPKRLASRVRAAQDRVADARLTIFLNEERIAQSGARIDEFEANPEGFAARHYPGQGVGSYPVITTISREREALERRRGRSGVLLDDLAHADARLTAIEAEVEAEVGKMRPSNGRVPWPKALLTFEKAAARFRASQDRQYARDAIAAQKYHERVQRDCEREMAENQRISDEEDERQSIIRRAELAAMTPGERAAELAAIRRLYEALKSGKTSFFEVQVRPQRKT